MSYLARMSIAHQTVMDEQGRPAAAIIPWAIFVELQELVDAAEPTSEEREAMLEAEADRREGNEDAFVNLSELEEELSL